MPTPHGPRPWRRLAAIPAAAALTLLAALALPARSDDGDRRPDYRPAAYAIRHAKVVVEPGRAIEDGTVVVRRGVIEAVGEAGEVEVPADAEAIDGEGLTVYPGFIDLYTVLGAPKAVERSETGPGRAVPYGEFALPSTPPDNRHGLTPEYEVASALDLPASVAADRRKLGFTDLLAAPGGSIATGQSALVSLSGLPRREILVRSPVALHINLQPPFDPPAPDQDPAVRRRPQGGTITYPMSLMGTIAHLRQAMLDAEYDAEAWDHFQANGGPRPPFDPALKALKRARARQVPTWWEANSRDEIHRALALADEFGTTATIVGGREADRVVDDLKSRDASVVLRLDFPEEPGVPSKEEYARKGLAERTSALRVLQHRKQKWEERVSVAGRLAEEGVKFAFGSDGIEKADTFHAQVRKAIEHGLPADAALDALTRRAAEIAGLGDRLGTIQPGKLGHLVVLTGPYEDAGTRVRYVFADGLKFDYEKEAKDGDQARGRRGESRKGGAAEKGEPGKDEPKKDEPAGDESKKDEPGPDETKKDEPKSDVPARDTAKPYLEDQPPEEFVDIESELDEDRRPSIRTGGDVLIRDARILTVGPQGTIEKGSILVRDGKIAAVGKDVAAPDGVAVIDAEGLVAMPGIIDTHSHMAVAGGVNEISLSIVPEVRVADVIDGDDPTIYRALAGGTTAARLLHGSANTIGGQDAIIKLKHGSPGRDMLLKDERRPQGVKFALGENVTRSRGRFPNTRMGVEAVIERAFLEGRAYADAREAYGEARSRGEEVPPFRRDLRLEALADIVDGRIKIHSHCYRSDEILMLLRVAERFGVRVRSLQHALEGYKVAAEIAAHGASTSTFSDWWAYKIEAFDAIPFNAALLSAAGVNVCIKSDSEELVRHLYLEAAKMMKYGGVTEDQALAMITLNSAKELGLDHRMGSIEVGKDADIALFNSHPFDTFARCELALIDGEVWFQRGDEGEPLDTRGGDTALPIASDEARARDLAINANPGGAYAIVGATIHPVSGPRIEGGTIVVSDGRITAVGDARTEVPAGAQTIDGRGLDVWPGMIDAGSLLGLFEIGSLPETQDFSDSAPFQPELRASVALHPDSTVIPVTRANGILTAVVAPTGGTISGQAAVIKLDGWVPSEMVLEDRAALSVAIPAFIPENPDGGRRRFGGGGPGGDPNERRQERLDAIKAQFKLALDYDKVRQAAQSGQADAPAPDPRLDALVPYAKGERPVIFRAERAREILDAIELAKDLELRAVVSGGAEAWKVADALKKADVPVIVSGTLRLPLEGTDPYDSAYDLPAELHEAGVRFAIRSGGQGPDQATAARNLPYEAATAAAYGLPDDEALKAVTLYPAQILGLDDDLGTLEVGKRANLVVTAGHLLQATTPVKALFIDGQPVAPTSKHTELYDKYRERLELVRSGKAPLGLDRKETGVTGTGSGRSSGSPSPADSSNRR
jgi:imidazolonepropionase-like amidohydrolase